MRSLEDPAGVTRAVSREREDRPSDAGAEVIDLVHLPVGARPLPFAEIVFEEVPDTRALDCETYHSCLSFAARVHWRGFHCRRCPKWNSDEAGSCAEPAETGSEKRATVIQLR